MTINFNKYTVFVLGLVLGLIFKESSTEAIIFSLHMLGGFFIFGLAISIVLFFVFLIGGTNKVLTSYESYLYGKGVFQFLKGIMLFIFQLVFLYTLINFIEKSGFSNENIVLFILFWGFQFYLDRNNEKED